MSIADFIRKKKQEFKEERDYLRQAKTEKKQELLKKLQVQRAEKEEKVNLDRAIRKEKETISSLRKENFRNSTVGKGILFATKQAKNYKKSLNKRKNKKSFLEL